MKAREIDRAGEPAERRRGGKGDVAVLDDDVVQLVFNPQRLVQVREMRPQT